MSSQKQFEIIRILDPLQKLFKPLPDSAMKLYLERLERHDLNDIRKAVNDLIETWDRTTFPPLAAFQKSLHSGMKSTAETTSSRKHPWEERNARINKAVNEFMHQFIKTQLYREAEVEGWENYVRRYAVELAAVQAHMIDGGMMEYSNHVLRLKNRDESNAMEADQHRACANGQISVTVPPAHIEYWKALAAYKRGKMKKAA